MERKLLAIGELVLDIRLREYLRNASPCITVMQPAGEAYSADAYIPAASVMTVVTDASEIDAIIEALVDIKTFLVNSQSKF